MKKKKQAKLKPYTVLYKNKSVLAHKNAYKMQ